MTSTAALLTYASPKLGAVPYSPADVVRFERGLPGFEGLLDYLVVTRDECAPFVFLAALHDPEVALPLLPLALAAGPEAGRIAAGAVAAAGVDPDGTIACYAVVVIGLDAREMVANLRAPVLIDLDRCRGVQVILGDDSLAVAAPLGP